jgi:hypothetical protein
MANDAQESEEPKLPLTVDSPIAWAEFLIDRDALRDYYKSKGIRCLDCCAAEAETFAEGAKVHEGGPFGGFDAAVVVDELNALGAKHPVVPGKDKPRSLLARILDMFF